MTYKTTDRQVELEREMREHGLSRYHKNIAKKVERGQEANTDYGQYLLRATVEKLEESITEFLEDSKISELLNKYNRFNQVPIKFGTEEINDPEFTPKTTKDKDGKETTEPHKQITVDKIIKEIIPNHNIIFFARLCFS